MLKHKIISDLIEQRKMTKISLANYIGLTIGGLENILKGSDVRASNLEKIADFFNLPIDHFFERNITPETSSETTIHIGHKVGGSKNVLGDITMSECKKEIEHLQILLKEKDTQLELMKNQLDDKERLIQVLMK